MAANERSKERLVNDLEREITQLFEKSLDYAQVACPTPDIYKALRSKILRVGNNCLRNVKKKVQSYEVEFIPHTEEVIQVRQPKTLKK